MNNFVDKFASRLDLHQSPMHATAMAIIGWQTIGKPGQQIFLRQFGPIRTAKLQRPTNIDPNIIKAFRQQHHPWGFYLEPGLTSPITSIPGWKIEPFAHSATSIIDLSPNEKTLTSSFSQKTRYNINLAVRKKIISVKTTPLNRLTNPVLDDFFALRSSWSERKGVYGYASDFILAIIRAYRDHGYIHTAYIGGIPEATLLVLTNDHVATYYSAFSSLKGYKNFAPTLLTWVSMQNAKTNDCDIYDFGGIYDPRYPKMYKKWIGFTKFKSGFSPTVVTYPESRLQIGW